MIGWLCRRTARFRNDDGGTALILISMALPAIFGMAAFAIDLGYAFYIKTKLQTAADLGALAGGTLLYKADKSAVEAKALEYVNLNLPSGWNGKTAASISVTPAASTARPLRAGFMLHPHTAFPQCIACRPPSACQRATRVSAARGFGYPRRVAVIARHSFGAPTD